jgi:hypothetical protein
LQQFSIVTVGFNGMLEKKVSFIGDQLGDWNLFNA